MDDRHRQYAEYYRARAQRFTGNPLYPESAAAQEAMAASIEQAASLPDWKQDMEQRNLNVACAVALARDQARAELDLYRSIEEPVRAAGPAQVLAEITGPGEMTATTVAARLSAIADANRKAIAVDELTTVFAGQLDILEEEEVTRTADVPEEWKPRWNAVVAEDAERSRVNWRDSVVPNARLWDPAWNFDEAKVWETRFRRRIPLPDAVVTRRLEQFRRYRGEA